MTPVFVVLALLVMGWFAGGSIWNIRKGNAIMRWMQDGLPLIGERTTMRWLGTTAAEMVIKAAKPPFRQVTLLVFFEPRDVPWNWALTRLRGRRDTLIIRAQLRTAPHADLEAISRTSWSGRDILRHIGSEQWSVAEPAAGGELPIYYKNAAALNRAKAMMEMARQAGLDVQRLSVRHTEPQFQLHITPPSTSASARDLFEAVCALGEKASG